MLTPVSNFENFFSASPSFRLSVCKHEAFFIICVQKILNTRLEMIEAVEALGDRCRFKKGHHKDK